MSFQLRLRDGSLKVFHQPCIMGIINMSPDSMHQAFSKISDALKSCEQMIKEGVAIIDVGGEATNPTVQIQSKFYHSIQEEMDRVLPIIEIIKKEFDVMVSVDTSYPDVMRESARLRVDMINDQRSLQLDDALETVNSLQIPVCLMHFYSYTRNPGDVEFPVFFDDIRSDLEKTTRVCITKGIDKNRIIIDPGFGQGNYRKNAQENFYLLSRLNELTSLGFPVLVGLSRKSMIGEALGGLSVNDRLNGSIAAAVIAAMKGAHIIRVHDVKETVQALRIVNEARQFEG